MMKCTAVSARLILRVLSVQPIRRWCRRCWLHLTCVQIAVKEIHQLPFLWGDLVVMPGWEQQVRRITCDPPTVTSGLCSHPALICHSLCADDWRGAEEQDNYDIRSAWLSSSRSWSDTEDKNGQHFPQESNPPHTTKCCLCGRRALHSGGGRTCISKGLDRSWFLSKGLHYNWLKFRMESSLWDVPQPLHRFYSHIQVFTHTVFPKPDPACRDFNNNHV